MFGFRKKIVSFYCWCDCDFICFCLEQLGERWVRENNFSLELGALTLSMVSSMSIVICNKAMMSSLHFIFGKSMRYWLFAAWHGCLLICTSFFCSLVMITIVFFPFMCFWCMAQFDNSIGVDKPYSSFGIIWKGCGSIHGSIRFWFLGAFPSHLLFISFVRSGDMLAVMPLECTIQWQLVLYWWSVTKEVFIGGWIYRIWQFLVWLCFLCLDFD